ncbi:MAG: hypothetical protein HY738_19690 [Bacteroidia bacterium]|nr:hypothetical protein [Bacteroidia bacterium]
MILSRKTTGAILSFAFITFLLQSCLKDRFDFDKFSSEIKWEPSLAVPVAYGRVSIYDAIYQFDSAEIIHSYPDGLIYIQYDKKVYSVVGKDIIDIPTQPFTQIFSGIEANSAGWSVLSNQGMVKAEIESFSVNGEERLDSIRLKGNTKLTINITSNFKHTGKIIVAFPEMKKNGESYSVTVNNNTTTGNFNFTGEYINLDGYSLDLSNLGTDTNKVLIRYTHNLYNSGATIADNDFTLINVTFSDIDFYSCYGYMGVQPLNIPGGTIYLDIFDTIFDGDLYFKDPKMKILMHNSYGLPVELGFTYLKSFSNIYQDTLPIVGSGVPVAGVNPKLIGYPSLSQVGQTIKDSIVLEPGNSNIDDVISDLPKYIFFGVNAVANPASQYTNTNFILDNSRFDVDLQVHMPLWGFARYFRLYDTVKVDMHEVVDSNNIVEQAIFRMIVDNGFPVDMTGQAYFTDSLYHVIDSLVEDVSNYIIPAGRPDNNGRVNQLTGTTNKINDFVFSAERIAKLHDVRYVIFGSKIWTHNYGNSENIRIYTDYTMRFRLGLRIDIDVSSNDNIDF